jgi:peptidoglycan LD-endopeptidase LytH
MLLLALGGIFTLAWTAADIPAPRQIARAAQATDLMVIPVAGVERDALHSNFAEWHGGHPHHAIDILAPRGTPVLAAVDGKVRKLFRSKAGGLTIYESDPAEQTIYYYAHLDRYADRLREGMELRRGDVIGYVGTTGNAPAHTPHLHFAIAILPPTKEWWKGEPIDPYPILSRIGVTRAIPSAAMDPLR